MGPLALGAMGAGVGGAAGGVLGQITDTLSYPRRELWKLFGLPERGSDILSQYAGMDPESLATTIGGMGLEMAGDPLTWLSLGLGGALGGIEGGALATRAGMLDDIARSQSAFDDLARLGANQQLDLAQEVTRQGARFHGMQDVIDPATLGTVSKTYTRNFDPVGGALMQKWGVGELLNEGPYGEFVLNQAKLPRGYTAGGAMPWMRGTAGPGEWATPAEIAGLHGEVAAQGGGLANQLNRYPPRAWLGTPSPAIGPTPEELALIRAEITQRLPQGPDVQSLPGFSDLVMGNAARARAAQLVPEPMVGGLSLNDAMAEQQSQLLQQLIGLGEFDAARQSPPWLRSAMIGSGLATGGMLGVNAAQPQGQRFF